MARGGCCYGSLLSKDCVSLNAPPGKDYSRPKETLNASYSSGLWTNNVDNIDMSLESNTSVGRSSPCTLKTTTLFGTKRFANTPWSNREEANILDGFGRDHTTSPSSPTLSCVTLQVTGRLTCTFHTGRMLNLWNNQAWKFSSMNGCC